MKKNALLIIDVQNDFCSHGALAVPQAEAIIPLINDMQTYFDELIATQDWHPANHMSFAANQLGRKIGETIKIGGISQILWPIHCVQNSHGAMFHPDLHISPTIQIIRKGTDPSIDSYSAFFDNAHLKKTELDDYLQSKNITTLYLVGLATDYCVKYSALDAIFLGYETYVITDACRGVNLNKDDTEKALQEMHQTGVHIVQSKDVYSLRSKI